MDFRKNLVWITVSAVIYAAPILAATPQPNEGPANTYTEQGVQRQGVDSDAFASIDSDLNLPGETTLPILDANSSRLTYQARLTDNMGNPLPGAMVDLVFNIYSAGNVLVEGPINMPGVPMNNGIVEVLIPITETSFTGAARELGVKVNGGAELTPRMKLGAVPYAFRVDRVASAELDDDIKLGRAGLALIGGPSNPGDPGSLKVSTGEAVPAVIGGDPDRDVSIELDGPTGRVSTEGDFRIVNSNAATFTTLASMSSGASGGIMSVYADDGFLSGSVLASSSGGVVNMFKDVGGRVPQALATLDGDDGDSGRLTLRRPGLISTIVLDGGAGSTPEINIARDGVNNDVELSGGALGGTINVRNGGDIFLHDENGVTTMAMQAQSGNSLGGLLVVRNAAGTATIFLDGDSSGDGRVITQELQITGGSDLSEQFDVGGDAEDIKPGMLVSIDPRRTGKLLVSTKAYDRTVAGIISGAGGIETGMMMGQEGSVANGAHPVALTGRVYCYCDASAGAIQPGDLLTTSDIPGHAMKAVDQMKAQGAVIGKAMTSLDEGRGLVLVLVSLQ